MQLSEQVRALEAHCEAMEALRKYARHADKCGKYQRRGVCDCGLDRALSAAPSPGEGGKPQSFKVGDRVVARREGANGAGVVARIEDGRYHYLSSEAGAYPYLASELTRAPDPDGDHEACGKLSTCHKCNGSRYDRDFDGACLECVAKERDALAARVKELEQEADTVRQAESEATDSRVSAAAVAMRKQWVERLERAGTHIRRNNDDGTPAVWPAAAVDFLRAEVERLKKDLAEAGDEVNALGKRAVRSLSDLAAKDIALAAAEKRMGEAREIVAKAQRLAVTQPGTAIPKLLDKALARLDEAAPSAGGTEGEGKAEPKSPFVNFEAATLKRLQDNPDVRAGYFEAWDTIARGPDASPPPASATEGKCDGCGHDAWAHGETRNCTGGGGCSCPGYQPAPSSASEGEKPAPKDDVKEPEHWRSCPKSLSDWNSCNCPVGASERASPRAPLPGEVDRHMRDQHIAALESELAAAREEAAKMRKHLTVIVNLIPCYPLGEGLERTDLGREMARARAALSPAPGKGKG